MLPDNALGDRLNAIKAGVEPTPPINHDKLIQSLIEEQTKDKEIIEVKSSAPVLALRIVNMIDILLASVLYGYALKGMIVTFSTIDWNFMETIGIGFAINTILTSIPKIYNFFKKS